MANKLQKNFNKTSNIHMAHFLAFLFKIFNIKFSLLIFGLSLFCLLHSFTFLFLFFFFFVHSKVSTAFDFNDSRTSVAFSFAESS